jgi:hypothetical protein
VEQVGRAQVAAGAVDLVAAEALAAAAAAVVVE